MHKNFKYIYIIIFIIISTKLLYSEQDKKYITFIKKDNIKISSQTNIIIDYLIDSAEFLLLEKNNNIYIKNINGEFGTKDLNNVVSQILLNGIDFFYYIEANEDNKEIIINIKLLNSIGEILFEKTINIKKDNNLKRYVSIEEEDEWNKTFINSVVIIFVKKQKAVKFKKIKSFNLWSKREIPFVSIGINAISTKLYFDNRMSERGGKLFSVSPIDFRLCFFPIKYFEVGMFFRIDLNNMVFRYYNYDKDRFDYFDTNILLYYGIFAGVSFFKEDLHYSLGLQFYNIYYDLSNTEGWMKSKDINSYFLPQFAVYQKFDFKIFKFLYFTLLVTFKTMPLFELKNDYFYSQPFKYDFFCIEFSFVGLSFIF